MPGADASPACRARNCARAFPARPLPRQTTLPLLRALKGPLAPESWRGALPITYHLGAGPATIHLKLEFNFQTVPAYDVIARLRGSERPHEWVVRGNHHDAWVNGAADPISGMVAVLAEAQAAGHLVKSGWRPKRTIIFAAWDGEEQALICSTEWAETHAAELQQKGVLYVNTYNSGRGFLSVGGSHTLEKFINEIAGDVMDPEVPASVLGRWRARQILEGTPEDRREARERPDLRISALIWSEILFSSSWDLFRRNCAISGGFTSSSGLVWAVSFSRTLMMWKP